MLSQGPQFSIGTGELARQPSYPWQKKSSQQSKNAGWVPTNVRILEAAWGAECVNEVNYVRLHIWRLGQKTIEEDSHQDKYILTQREIGYRLAKGQ